MPKGVGAIGEPVDAAQLHSDAEASDEELIRRLRAGELSAYTALWVKHIDAALKVARRVAPNQAEDLASEGFLAL